MQGGCLHGAGVGVRPRSGQMIMNRGELPMRISILKRIVARAPLAWRVDRLRAAAQHRPCDRRVVRSHMGCFRPPNCTATP
jgi:hypothetical protein